MTQRAPATSPADRGAFGARPQPVAWAVESRLRGDRPLGQRTPRGGGRAPCGGGREATAATPARSFTPRCVPRSLMAQRSARLPPRPPNSFHKQ